SGGGKSVTGVSDAQGIFLLGLAAGTHAISLAKPDYQSGADTTVAMTAGKSLDLGRLVMVRAQGSLSGTVANEKGAPLAGCAVTVKNSAGTVARTLLSDDKGVFSAFLPPGKYTVVVARAGFSTEQKILQLTEAASLPFILVSGAALVKGRISIRTWPTASETQSSPLAGSVVELIDRAHGIGLKTEADLRGEYSFSADTGVWLLRASGAGKARSDSIAVRIALARSTSTQDLTLAGFASIQGTIELVPDTLADPATASVSLLNPVTLALAATTVPRREPRPGSPGAMAFQLDGIPDGTYRLACAMPGYGLDTEPVVSVLNGVWQTGVALALKKSDKSVTIALTVGGQPAQGTIRLITPQSMEFPAGQKLAQAAAGTYTFTAAADSADVIPVARQSFFLPASGSKDTTVTLALPFSHRSAPLSFRDGLASLALNAQARIDSAAVIYGYGAPTDTFRVPVSQLFGPVGPRTFKFKPGPQGGLLTYWFVIKSGSLIYANDEPSRRFQAMVTASRDLAFLRMAAGDSLRLPAHARGEIHLHAYDAAGRRLDTEADERGVFTWKADSALGMRLDRKSKRTLDYLTAEASSNLPGGQASPKRASGQAKRGGYQDAGGIGRVAAELWDTLTVTVALDGIEKSLSLPTRVVDAVINKLVMGSSLGEVSDLPAPASFSLFVTGYDTTTSPPTAIVPNPILSLVPPEAGTIGEMQVVLHPRFIGPVRVLARQVNPDGSEAATELGAYRDSASRGLNVGQTLAAGDTARTLFHDPAFEITVPDSGFTGKGRALIRVYKRSVAKTFASGIDNAVAGGLWEITNPSDATFTKKPRLSLGIPGYARARKNSLKRFDTARLDFKALVDTVGEGTNGFGVPALSAGISDLDGSYYGLLSASQPLTAGEVRIVPNPFSPLVMAERDGNTQYGARIRIHPESDRSSEVTLSIKIYNLDGELVRLLVDHKTVPKAPVDFYWDGKADSGRWARNGRYLVKIAVNATGSSHTRQVLRPIVVFQ
ncbi:MAG: carboxypeptidase regulatory-like domain-containing protein, partial [Fibrobacteria bacterium]